MKPTPDTIAVDTTCPYCGVGCGVKARPAMVEGDSSHPANSGRLCVKGAALHETLVPAGRLLAPRVKGREVDWTGAAGTVAGAIRDAVDRYGPGSVGFYLSGQLLTEDYYIANKLAKGFIGTPHVDTNSRLCMSSAVAAHKRAFGEDCVPGCYEDLELADLLVLAGSNAAWAHPVLYQRMKAASRTGRKVVVIDPRKTATTELADLHLALKPGTDTTLFNGLLAWLADQGRLDRDYLDNHCRGFEEALASARRAGHSVAVVARQCDLAPADVECFFRWFAETPRTVTAFSQGINQSVAGTDKGNSIINCHLATGRVGLPGAGPFSLTGQPNAMGGREVGGLANTLACHLDYDSPGARELVAGFWGTDRLPEQPGLKAVDLFDAVHQGEIRVLWIMGTNPAVSLPQSDRIREALARCPTVIVSDCVADTDTTAFADILLPAAGWGEKDGTVTNSERRISRQRKFLPLPGDVRPDWWIMSEVAGALGYGPAFRYEGPMDIFREHAALSGIAGRCFNIAPLASLDREQYDRLEPVQWPVVVDEDGSLRGTRRLFSDGAYATTDSKARLVPVETVAPVQSPTNDYPLIVNTGRVRDQWHTMTRTALAPRLLAHRTEPFIEVHPEEAERRGVLAGGLGILSGPDGGAYVGRIRVTPAMRAGEVFIPIHWNRRFTPEGLASSLIRRVTDPVSGQPESKHGIARLEPLETIWQARLMRRSEVPGTGMPGQYRVRQPLANSQLWSLAGNGKETWATIVADLLGGPPQLLMADPAEGRFRAARLCEGRLEGVLMVDSNGANLPDTDWLDSMFALAGLDESERRSLLAGRAFDGDDAGALVCSCFQVGEKRICQAIADGAGDVETLGQKLRCGTSCGSCLPELKALLAAVDTNRPVAQV
ncbi:molybdopterin-dependent oxidoreductase [Marinobacter sp. DUT-1]|uniref:nitrate reductase n=1 Tax=Marinobacter sp. DUT-1 TaxID=3412037 RepID=UPI003D17BA28